MYVTAFIVWVMGGFPCGEYTDITIYYLGLNEVFKDGEKVITDGGYKGEEVIRARHENVNSRINFFNVLNTRFCHGIDMHGR